MNCDTQTTSLESLLNQVDALCCALHRLEIRVGEIEAYIRTHPVPFDTPLELD